MLLNRHPIDIYRELDKFFDKQDWLHWEAESFLLNLKNKYPNLDDAEKDKLLAIKKFFK